MVSVLASLAACKTQGMAYLLLRSDNSAISIPNAIIRDKSSIGEERNLIILAYISTIKLLSITLCRPRG
jgi:hypothetical protein